MSCAICGRLADSFLGGMYLYACHAGDDNFCDEED